MWSNLGQQIQQAIQSYSQQRQQAPILEQEQRVRDVQLSNAEAQAAERERDTHEDTAFLASLEQDPNPDPKTILTMFSSPQRGMQIAVGLRAFHAKPDPSDLDAKSKVLRDRMLGVNALTPEIRARMYPDLRQQSIQDGLITEQDAPEAYDEDWWTQTINYAKAPPTEQKQNLQSVDPTRPIVDLNDPNARVVRPGVPSAPTLPANIEAAIFAADRDGDKAEVNRLMGLKRQSAAAGRAPEKPEGVPGADRQPSTAAFQAATFADRLDQAEQILGTTTVSSMNPASFAFQAFMDNPNLQSEAMQQYQQAARNFINAVLRRESGAAISPTEFAEARSQYLPLPGDSDAVKKQKAETRRLVRAGLRREAGSAAGRSGGVTEVEMPDGTVLRFGPDGRRVD